LSKSDGPAADSSAALGPPQPYQGWRYLAPRIVRPTLQLETEAPGAGDPIAQNGLSVGLSLQGADPLQQWSYGASGFYRYGRLGGAARLATGQLPLRPSLTAFWRPTGAEPIGRNDAGADPRILDVQEERGVALGLRLPVTLERNVYQSFIRPQLRVALRETRRYALPSLPPGVSFQEGNQFRARLTVSPGLSAGAFLQQNPRDLVPNTGLSLGLQSSLDAWSERRAQHAVIGQLNAYLPFLSRYNIGLRLSAAAFTRDANGRVGAGTFVPRGYEEASLGSGSFVRLDAMYTQPLWYIDNGFVLFPLYFRALYGYGFGQTLLPVEGTAQYTADGPDGAPVIRDTGTSLSSVGVGLGLEVRLFYSLTLDLRIGAAYRLEAGDIEPVFR
jgi:hypothetical protein